MDRLTVISCALFLSANLFAVISLILPDWIVSDVGGNTRLGLLRNCMTIYGRDQVCFTPSLRSEWTLALACIVLGCFAVFITVLLLISSHWHDQGVPYARWIGFCAMGLFCAAAVIFPVGFTMEEIGGEAYQLPSSHQVGLSYIFFVLALWITVISELFAGKVCMPHF
ncbi:uncharacterized protein C16orf52 homolog A [Parasteatoda tepidariorum]|nr:uncharacterized protein C16orf52 homolog A-like [Parasteatoda tepidariorum]